MSKNCYDCKYAIASRDLPRQGEQVRCAMAEELFGTKNIKGGERWVNVRKSEKTGKLLNSKCGTFEPFIGDESQAPEVELPEDVTLSIECSTCRGTGKMNVRIMMENQSVECTSCQGKGSIPQ